MTFEGGQSQSIVAWLFALILALIGATGQSAQDAATPAASPVAPAAADCAAAEPSGLIVYQALRESDAAPSGNVIVVEPATGNVRHRVTVPGTTRVWPTSMPGRVFVSGEQDRLHLLDADAGTVTELALPEGDDDYVPTGGAAFSRGQGTRYMLLSSTQQSQAVLVDLESSTVTDLLALTGERFVFFGMVSPDDTYAVVTFDDGAYLIPTADPAAFRQLGGDSRTGGAVLSPDGSLVAYYRETGEQGFELIVEGIDGSNSRVVATHDTPLTGQFAGSSDRILVRTIDTLLLIDLATGEERELLHEYVSAWIVAPDGGNVLVQSGEEVRSESELGEAWAWIDLDTGDTTVNSERDDHILIPPSGDPRWVFMVDSLFFGGGSEDGDTIYAFDLTTGDVRALFKAQPGESYLPPYAANPDGRYALLYAGLEGSGARIRLLDSAAGTARVIAEGGGVSGGAISPDGCWITLETMTEVDGRKSRFIAIQPIAGGAERPVAENGFQAIWLASSR
ncbi:MAG: WD40 repeat domain-containing protein [Thermomicrobiales bacterium]